jgi:hypothetical protein
MSSMAQMTTHSAACYILVISFFLLERSTVMASETLRFRWQWPAGREPDYKLLVDVQEVRKESSGIFGIKKSESMASQLPDAIELIGSVIMGPDELIGRKVIFRAPRAEVRNVVVGQAAGVAVIARDRNATNICICIQGAPKIVEKKALRAWLSDMKCE